MIFRILRKRIRIVSWIITASLLFLVFSFTDLHTFWETLKESNWGKIAVAISLAFIGITGIRTLRLLIILNPLPRTGQKLRLFELLSVLSASRLLNLIFPARAGELLRITRLSQRFGISPESSIASLGLETIMDVLTLAIPAAPLLFFNSIPNSLSRTLFIFVALGGIVLLISFWLIHRQPQSSPKKPHKITQFLQVVAYSIRSILRAPPGWIALGCTFFINILDIIMINLCLGAVGVSLDWISSFLILAVINFSTIIPTPGNLGTLEASAIFALQAEGVNQAPALAFALLYHFAHLLPTLIWGSWALPVELQYVRPQSFRNQ